MYITNGIAYAENQTKLLEIKHLKVLEDGILLLTFNNGEKRLFDTTELKGPVYDLIDDESYLSAKLEDGVVTWLDGRIDCAPEFMYEHSYKYEQSSELSVIFA